MLHLVWEHTSLYYILPTLLAIVCLALTWYYGADRPCQPSPTEPTIGDANVSMVERKPLRLAKKLEEKLPEERQLLEKRIKDEQLEAIYKLMQEHRDQFGTTTMEDMRSQMQLYGF